MYQVSPGLPQAWPDVLETAPARDGPALAQQKTGQCPSGQAAAAAGLTCLQPPTHHSSMLSNEIMDGMSCCSIWFNDRIWLASVATKHMLTSHHSSLCAGAGRGWVVVGKNGGRGGGCEGRAGFKRSVHLPSKWHGESSAGLLAPACPWSPPCTC